MREYPVELFIYIGGAVQHLCKVPAGYPIHGSSFILEHIKSVLSWIDDLELKVTKHGCRDLRELASKLEAYPIGHCLSDDDAAQLYSIMAMVEHTLRAETVSLNAYVLTEKKLDTKKLVERPECFLADETFKKLPQIARCDFREAGKCIAFELPTAGAFHLLRATEDTLRSYYGIFFKRKRRPRMNWGPMVTALRNKRRRPRPSEIVLNNLDNIRVHFRNPTDHPELVYKIDEVQDLFSLVVDILNRMAKELPEAEQFVQLKSGLRLKVPPRIGKPPR